MEMLTLLLERKVSWRMAVLVRCHAGSEVR